jgi:hypothetical protein
VDASDDARKRAWTLAAGCPMPASADGIHMLAWMLTGVAAEHRCAPGDVPLDILGYWLSHRQRFPGQLDLPWHPAYPLYEGDRERHLNEAIRVVTYAWLVEVGRLRLGDHVIITPESLLRPGPSRRGVIVAATFDNPDFWNDIAAGRIPPDPHRFAVLLDEPPPGDDPGPARGPITAQDPWGLLLDEAHHPGEPDRARAIRTYTAIRDLRHAGSLVNMQGARRTRGYLQARAEYYPAEVAGIFRDAAAKPTLDPDEITMLALRLP